MGVTRMASFKITETEEAVRVERIEASAEEAQAAFVNNPDEGVYFVRQREDVAMLPNRVAVAVYNATHGTPVVKFTNRATRIDRVWDALMALSSPVNKPKSEGGNGNMATKAATKASAKRARGSKATNGAKAERQARSFKDIEPVKTKAKLKAARAGSKVARLIDLLNKDNGTTIQEIEAKLSETGRPINARSWLGHSLRQVHGYGVKARTVDGKERLFLWLPEDTRKPLDHKSPEAE